MRKETKEIVRAFMNGKPRRMARTHTDGQAIYLHNNRIAWREGLTIYATLAHWPTTTTRERLNGLCNELRLAHGFYQSKHEQYFGPDPIGSGDVINLSEQPKRNF
jgi:hypothetical protein